MEKEFEVMAYNGQPVPAGVNWRVAVEYIVSRYLYAANRAGFIDREPASQEKKLVTALLDEKDEAREFERRCWENSARRTMSACHAMTMYRQNRTLEHADILVNRLEWLEDECAIQVKPHKHGANCPICGKFFNQDHAARKPTYCESCGCRLGWYDHNEGAE